LTDSVSMRALPVRPQPLWLVDFRQRVVVSLWFIPAIFAVVAIALANLAIWLDSVVAAPVAARPDLVADQSVASTFAGAIAAATLAFVAVVFATTLVAIQLAASQYSPRTVRIFFRSRVTRVTLGLFLATFIFSLIMLVDNRSTVNSAKRFAPVVSVTVLLALTIATVFGFIAYLHGVVRLMRVQYLLEAIASEAGPRLRRTSRRRRPIWTFSLPRLTGRRDRCTSAAQPESSPRSTCTVSPNCAGATIAGSS
jgi:uncharacterized membrane protein